MHTKKYIRLLLTACCICLCFILTGNTSNADDEIDSSGTNLIQNGDFENGDSNWITTVCAPAEASYNFDNGKATFDISNVGTANWHIQLAQHDIVIETEGTYLIEVQITSDVDRTIELGFFMPSSEYQSMGIYNLTAGEPTTIRNEITFSPNSTVRFACSLGKVNEESASGTIVIDQISMTYANDSETTYRELIQNGDFNNGNTYWSSNVNLDNAATYQFTDGKAIFDITDVGESNSTVQLKQAAAPIEYGRIYHLEMEITSDVARKIEIVLMDDNFADYYGGGTYDLLAGKTTINADIVGINNDSNAYGKTANFILCMGKVDENDAPGRIVIERISLSETDNFTDPTLPEDSDKTEEHTTEATTETSTEEPTTEKTTETPTENPSTEDSTEETTEIPTTEESDNKNTTEESTTDESINQGNTDINNQNGSVTPDTSNPSDTGTTDSNNSSNSGTNDNNNSSTNTDDTTTPPTQTKTRPEKGTLITHKNLQYKVTGKNTVTFIKPLNKKITKLTIPATFTYEGYKYKVTKISNKACYQCKKLKKVTIGNNVTQIGDNAFAKCTVLNNITFGTNVKKLGKKVLYNDTKLSKITFKGKKLQSIGKQTFRKVPKSVRIIVPNSRVSKYSRLINNAV